MRQSRQTIPFIHTAVRAAEALNRRRTQYRVLTTKGNDMERLILEVMPNGKRYWRYVYDVRIGNRRIRKKKKLGDGNTPLHLVRDEWADFHHAVSKGRDPIAESIAREEELLKRKEEKDRSLSFHQLAKKYMDRRRKDVESYNDDWRKLNNQIFPHLGKLNASEIQKRDIIRVIDEIAKTGPVNADRCKSLIRQIYNYGRDEDIVDINPAERIRNRSGYVTRDRVLQEEEIRKIWIAIETQQLNYTHSMHRIVIKLALVLGQRPGEIVKTRKSDLDFGGKYFQQKYKSDECQKPVWSIPRQHSKNQKAHRVPLSPWAVDLFRNAIRIGETILEGQGKELSEFVFPSTKTGKPISSKNNTHEFAHVAKSVGIDDASLYCIKHTVKTAMARMNIDKEIRSRIMNHSGKQEDIDDRYNHYEYYDECYVALELWQSMLKSIVSNDDIQELSRCVDLRELNVRSGPVRRHLNFHEASGSSHHEDTVDETSNSLQRSSPDTLYRPC